MEPKFFGADGLVKISVGVDHTGGISVSLSEPGQINNIMNDLAAAPHPASKELASLFKEAQKYVADNTPKPKT